MPVPQIPLDIVHAIAQQIDGFGPFPPFIWPLAGVCRGWRMTILPMLFKTLHIPMGQEQKCLEFLRTDTGKGISDSVKVLRIKSSLSSLLPALPHLHSHLPQIQRIVIDIRSFDAPTVEDFNECSLIPLRTLSIKSLCITIPGFLDWHRYVLWNTFMNTFLAIDELEVRFMHGDVVSDLESPAVKTMKIFREKPGSLPLIMFVDVSSLIVRDFSWCQNFPWLLQTQQTKLMIWKASSQESPLRSVTFDCASPHAFGAFCDLMEVAGSDIATISLTMWNGHAPHPGNADWDSESQSCCCIISQTDSITRLQQEFGDLGRQTRRSSQHVPHSNRLLCTSMPATTNGRWNPDSRLGRKRYLLWPTLLAS